MEYIRNKSLTMQLDRMLHPENWANTRFDKRLNQKKIIPEQRKTLIEYNKFLEANNLKLISRENKIRALYSLSLHIIKPYKNFTQKDIENYFVEHNNIGVY